MAAKKKGGGRGRRGQAFVEDPPRVVGDNRERDIALNAALEEHCRLQDQEDALIEKYIAPIRDKKAEVKAKVKKDWEIPTAAFNARAALRMIELGDDPEVVLATQQMFDATPVGANLDLIAIAERVAKKKTDEKAEADAKAKAKEEKKAKAKVKEVQA